MVRVLVQAGGQAAGLHLVEDLAALLAVADEPGAFEHDQVLGDGLAVASSIAASYSRTLAHHRVSSAVALTGGFTRALVVCGLSGLAAIPVTFALIRRGR